MLVPACKEINLFAGVCTETGADPGVFKLSATGTGKAGTTCAAAVFDIAVIDPTFGTVRFTRRPAGTHVTLPGAGSSCEIGFTFAVLKSPTGDQDPTSAGTQTAQVTEHSQFSGASGDLVRAVSGGTTVLRAGPPSIATTASPAVALGSGTLTDSATVSGLANPVPGSTISFQLYGPDNATCTGTPVFTSTKAASLAGSTATATSNPFTPTQPGTYRWIASFTGDANNLPVAGACNAPNESTVVNRAATTIETSAPSSIVLGFGTLYDSARVYGRVDPQPGAMIDFRLYGPDDATCAGTPVFESLGVPYSVAGGPENSAEFEPTQAGTYRWIASYSGDANNAPVAGACNDAGETSIVDPAPFAPAPRIVDFRFSPNAFPAVRPGARSRAKIRFRITDAAAVRVVIYRIRPGRRVGDRCLAATRGSRSLPKCRRYLRVGVRTLYVSPGANAVGFNGRIGVRRLAVGLYRATATATNNAGKASGPVRASFTIVSG